MDNPAPGSPVAVEKGCTCPVMDNNNGKGFMINGEGPMFWMQGDCPFHGYVEEKEDG